MITAIVPDAKNPVSGKIVDRTLGIPTQKLGFLPESASPKILILDFQCLRYDSGSSLNLMCYARAGTIGHSPESARSFCVQTLISSIR